VGSDACNPDFVGNSTSTIVFWDWITADGAADLFIWDGATLTNITNSTLYSEYEPVSNSDGSVILYWSGETTTEPVNTTHTLTYSGGSWVVDSGFAPITDSYWSFWSGQGNNNIGVVVVSTKDVHIYDSIGNFLFDVTGPGYSGGSGQWNFIGFNYEGHNGELLLTSNAGRSEAGRDIIIANPRNALFVDAATGSNSNPGTPEAPFLTVSKAISVADEEGVISVAAGTYPEQIIITQPVSINGADGAILDGATLGSGKTGVAIKSGNVTFNNIDVVNFSGNGIICGYEASIPGNLQNIHITNCLISSIIPGSSHGFGIYVGYESEGFGNGKLTGHLDYAGLLIENNEISYTANAALVLQSITAGTGTLHVNGNYMHHANASGVWIDCARNIALEDNIIDHNNYGFFLSAYAEPWYTQDGSYSAKNISIIGNEITNNITIGIGLYNGWTSTIIIEDNLIDGNPAGGGVRTFLAGSLDASPNWWGDLDPSDDINGNVQYDPWYDSAAMDHLMSNAPVQNVTRNLFYQTIQEAVDGVNDDEHITIAAGIFDQTMNITGKSGLTITGAGEGITTFKPSTVVPWNYFGHTTGRRAAIRIVESQDITIEGITLDCDLIKNNGWTGVFYGNSSGCVLQASTLTSMYTDQAHYYDIMVYARAMEPFSNDAKATLDILDCDLIDTGRVGIVTHDYVHTVIDGNNIYKTTNTFGYGMEIGSSSTAVITDNEIYGFDTPALSDGSTSGGIYIENCYTTAFTTPVSKPIVISANQVYDCQMGIMVGNQWNNYAGDVDIELQITNNILTNNTSYGILLCDEDHANGSSVTAVLTGNNISSTLDTPDAIGIMVYGTGDADLDVTLTNNVVTGYDFGLLVYDYGADPLTSEFVLNATGNTFSYAEYGVYTGMVNWIPVRLDNPNYTGNTFRENTIHMDNSSGEAIDMEAVVANNTFEGGAYQFD
jgi:hypothetical protein